MLTPVGPLPAQASHENLLRHDFLGGELENTSEKRRRRAPGSPRVCGHFKNNCGCECTPGELSQSITSAS